MIADKFSKDANFREGRIESGLVNGGKCVPRCSSVIPKIVCPFLTTCRRDGVDIGKEDRDALQSQLLRFVKKFASSVFSIFHFFLRKENSFVEWTTRCV